MHVVVGPSTVGNSQFGTEFLSASSHPCPVSSGLGLSLLTIIVDNPHFEEVSNSLEQEPSNLAWEVS